MLVFCLIQQLLLELPLLGYAFAPERTKRRSGASRGSPARSPGRRPLRPLGVLLLLRGVIELIAQ